MQSRNVPAIDASYWAAILAASVLGANMGDIVAHPLHLGHSRGLLPLAVLLAAILWAERRARRPNEIYYWLAIVTLRTAATNLADLATHDFRLSYVAVCGALTVLMAAVMLLTRRRSVMAADADYWVTMLMAGTLGTALGDYSAEGLGLGVGPASLLLVILLGIVLLAKDRTGWPAWITYWITIVVVRTAGTTMGDYFAGRDGLTLGLPLSAACSLMVMVGILVTWRGKRRRLAA